MIQIKTLSLLQGNPQNNDEILTVELVLHDRQNNFYVLVMPSLRNRRQGKQIINEETDTTAVILYLLKKEKGHEGRKGKYTSKKKQVMR